MNNNSTPAYLIGQIDVKDYQQYMERYGIPGKAVLQKYDAEVLIASAAAKNLEGEVSGNWTVIIRFPSIAVAEEFYYSSEYQQLKKLRVNELTNSGSVQIVEGLI